MDPECGTFLLYIPLLYPEHTYTKPDLSYLPSFEERGKEHSAPVYMLCMYSTLVCGILVFSTLHGVER